MNLDEKEMKNISEEKVPLSSSVSVYFDVKMINGTGLLISSSYSLVGYFHLRTVMYCYIAKHTQAHIST